MGYGIYVLYSHCIKCNLHCGTQPKNISTQFHGGVNLECGLLGYDNLHNLVKD
jgi:hypothetical protein